MKKSICAAAFPGTIFVPVIAARSQCSNGVCGNPISETVPLLTDGRDTHAFRGSPL